MAKRPNEVPVATLAPSRSAEVPVHRVDPEGAGDPEPVGVDPDHHLWRNGRLWWIAFTVHRGHLQERVRFSLRTDDVAVARRRRDEIFALYESAADCRISIRLRPQRGSRRGERRERETSGRRAVAR